MKYEVLLKVKDYSRDSFHQIGRIVVPSEYVNAQYNEYTKRAERMKVFDFVVLVNELTDDGEFVRCVK